MEWEGFPVLNHYVKKRVAEFDRIPPARKAMLERIALHLARERDARGNLSLVFICTHNSRRSHMAHLWAHLAASFYDLEGFTFCSGGTEATAFNPRAVRALEEAGMEISQTGSGPNPLYRVRLPGEPGYVEVFSKKYTDPPNPPEGFMAMMTCSEADEACPVVIGAASRHSLTYEDPGSFDDTDQEASRYRETSLQISREMFYLLSLL